MTWALVEQALTLGGPDCIRLLLADALYAGPAPAVIYLHGCYAVLALEDLLAGLGVPVRESLLPDLPP